MSDTRAGGQDTGDRPAEESRLQTSPVPFARLLELLEQQRRLGHYGEDRPGETAARPPGQPRNGPGGAEYAHRAVRRNLYGGEEMAYWVFEPSRPTPESAPLVVFLHGWGGGSPAKYGAWFDHLVRRGHIVVFPIYQGSMQPWARPWNRTSPTKMLDNVVSTVKDAIQRLGTGGHVRPDLLRFAVAGCSLGGALTTQLAAVAGQRALPIPKAIMPMVPGRGLWARTPLPTVNLQRIPSSILMVVVVCEDDLSARDFEGKAIFRATPQIPAENKNYVVMLTDRHGTPSLVANHNSPAAGNPAYGMGERDLTPPDARQYYGYWKLFDGLIDAAFHGRHRQYALGDTPEQRFMGVWSDGVPVKPLMVVTDATSLPPFRLHRRADSGRR